MSTQNVEIVRQIFEAINREDIDFVLTLTHPDFEVAVPPALSAEPDVYRGRDGMRRYWRTFQDAMDEIRFRAQRIWDTDRGVLVAMRITAKGRQTGIAVEQRVAGVWTVCEGLARRVQVYASLATAFEVVGMAPQGCEEEEEEQVR